ncbi:MAG TPA: hypothetical protein PK490_06580 [Prosthecobacter sp.]|nr:hypothetical protein [Prosthecobacter sp.]HRK13936.1 hypothetical protein [Prosthecobacter sp.]
MKIPHTYRQFPGIPHDPNMVLDTLGEDNRAFYRRTLSGEATIDSTDSARRSTHTSPSNMLSNLAAVSALSNSPEARPQEFYERSPCNDREFPRHPAGVER